MSAMVPQSPFSPSARQRALPRSRNHDFFRVAVIARAARVSTTRIHARAAKGFWPRRRRGHRIEYAPPAILAEACRRVLSLNGKASGLTFIGVDRPQPTVIGRKIHRL